MSPLRLPELTLLFLFFITPAGAFAQILFATTNVEMSVVGSPSLNKTRDMNLGTVVQGITSIAVDPTAGTGSAASFTLNAMASTSLTISFSSTNLTWGASSIMFTPLLSGNTLPDQLSSGLLANSSTIHANSSGNFYLWAGGSAILAPDQPTGIYSGTFTITIAY